MSVRFDHTRIEKKWQEEWNKNKIYSPNVLESKKPFYNLMMYPYPSAEGLHVGNMYAFTGADVYGRFQRMSGNDVFEPIGLDGFGIHSENYAIKVGRHPKEHAKISEKNFYEQLHMIGNGFDWDRKLETYDSKYYKWTQWLFVKMFKAGLAYKANASVNWCPSDKTVLADEQVIDGKCERCGSEVTKRDVSSWFFRITKYADRLLENIKKIDWPDKIKLAQTNWIGKKDGVLIHHKVKDLDTILTAFSAYPAWLFADTFLVVAPEHPIVSELVRDTKYQKDVEKFIENVKKNKEEKGTKLDEKEGMFTGRVVIDPFSGNEMPVWLANFALMDFGTGIIRCSAHDPRDYEFAQKYDIKLKEIVKRTEPDLPVNAHTNEVELQDSGPFTGKNISPKLISEMVDWIASEKIGERTITYHLRDWLISRQRYWGPPIPMVNCKDCGWQAVPEKDLPVLLPDIKDFKPQGDGTSPLHNAPESWKKVKCPNCGKDAERELDVSDTFLDSSWYFLRYPSVGSKSENELPFDPTITKKWLPVNAYIGGAEHAVLHLLYARFVTMFLKDQGYLDFEEPFPYLFGHGLIIKDGAKMSKSKGNIVNPDEYIKKYGADVLRMYLMFLGPYDQGGDFRDTGMEGVERFLGRVRRLFENSKKLDVKNEKDLYTKLHQTIDKVTDDFSKFKFNTSIAAIMELVNAISEYGADKETLKSLLLLLAPFAPHLTEELWVEVLGQPFSIHKALWPHYNAKFTASDEAVLIIQVNGRLRGQITVGSDVASDKEKVIKLAKGDKKVEKWIKGGRINKEIFVPGKLINFVVE